MHGVFPGPSVQVSLLALVFLLLGSWTGLSLPPDLYTGLEKSRMQFASPVPVTSGMYTCPSGLIPATFAPAESFLTCRPGPCAPHMLLGDRAVLHSGDFAPEHGHAGPFEGQVSTESLYCVTLLAIESHCFGGILRNTALTNKLIILKVCNRFSMGISSQPVPSARDSEVLCPCLCSPGAVLKCVAGIRTVASGVFFCCHEGGPDTLC